MLYTEIYSVLLNNAAPCCDTRYHDSLLLTLRELSAPRPNPRGHKLLYNYYITWSDSKFSHSNQQVMKCASRLPVWFPVLRDASEIQALGTTSGAMSHGRKPGVISSLLRLVTLHLTTINTLLTSLYQISWKSIPHSSCSTRRDGQASGSTLLLTKFSKKAFKTPERIHTQF